MSELSPSPTKQGHRFRTFLLVLLPVLTFCVFYIFAMHSALYIPICGSNLRESSNPVCRQVLIQVYLSFALFVGTLAFSLYRLGAYLVRQLRRRQSPRTRP